MLVNYKQLSEKERDRFSHKDAGILNERARLIFEQSPFTIQIFNKKGECIEANKAWEKMYKTEMSNLIGYNVLKDPQVAAIGTLPFIQKAFDGEMAEPPIFLYDPAMSGHPGKAVWLRTVLYPILDAQNKVTEVVMFLEDVSAEREASETLKKKNKELERTINLMVGRELKIIELKKELAELKSKTGLKADKES